MDDVIADDEVRVVVFTGEGKSFIAGRGHQGDGWLCGTGHCELFPKGVEIFRKIELMTKPTIAAVNGYAFGGGFEFVLCTDIRFACSKAKFRLPEVTLGIVRASMVHSAFQNALD